MRSMPNTAPTINAASRMMTDTIGALTAISPMRSSPKAMLVPGRGSSICFDVDLTFVVLVEHALSSSQDRRNLSRLGSGRE